MKSAAETTEMVKDLRRGIEWLVKSEGVDPWRIGYVGHSFGATAGAALLGVEPRIRAAVMMAGLPALTESLRRGDHRVAAAFRAQLSPEGKEAYLEAMRPLDGIHFLSRRPRGQPLLLQFAERDEFINRWDAAVYEFAAGEPCRVELHPADHLSLLEAARGSRLAWLRERLR